MTMLTPVVISASPIKEPIMIRSASIPEILIVSNSTLKYLNVMYFKRKSTMSVITED